MPKIEIREVDNTTPGVLDENFDVVYIPGFVNTAALSTDETTKGFSRLEPRVPTLFTSLKTFTAKCGSAPATFKTKQDYRTLNTGSAVGFSSDAVPFDNVMFEAGAPDPSYIMAKELLAAGLNVIYERVNTEDAVSTQGITLTALSDLDTSVSYRIDIPAYRPISSPVPPRLFKEVDADYVVGRVGNPEFFELNSDGASYSLVPEDELNETNKDKYGLTVETPTETTTEIHVTSESKLYVRTAEYFRKSAGTDSTVVPVVLDAEDEIITKDIPNIDNSPINSYPKDWNTRYYLDYYEKTVVTDNITVNNTDIVLTDANLKSVLTPQTGTVVSVLVNNGVKCYAIEDTITIAKMYEALASIFDKGNVEGIVDRGNFNIKYLTAGGYPVYEYNNNSLVTQMLGLAVERGDCVAIIDHTNNPYRETNVDKDGSLYNSVTGTFDGTDGEFGAMFTPWCNFNRTTSDKNFDKVVSSGNIRLGGSFAYLGALADSIKTNAPWLAIAGATRGKVRNLSANGVTSIIPNGAADFMQPRTGTAVNAITDIKPYGNVIWGNRTLKKNDENLVATSFLNIRNLVSDVKKICYRTARKLTFEQNNDILWVNFKSMIAPTLDRMVSGYGISGYKFVRDMEHEQAAAKATLCAKIFLYPVEPVEDFYITIMLEDDEVTVQ